MAEAFLKPTDGDAQALLPLLDTFVDTPAAVLAGFDRPILVVIVIVKDTRALAIGLPVSLSTTLPVMSFAAKHETAVRIGKAAAKLNRIILKWGIGPGSRTRPSLDLW